MKPKVFYWEGIAITLVEREEVCLDRNWSIVKDKVPRTIAPNGGVIPVNFTGKTQRGFINQTIALLDGLARVRSKEEVIHELTKSL